MIVAYLGQTVAAGSTPASWRARAVDVVAAVAETDCLNPRPRLMPPLLLMTLPLMPPTLDRALGLILH